MDLRKAVRDPWVWGQLALFALIGVGAPLLRGSGSIGHGTRWLGAPLIAVGLALAAWGVRSLGRGLTPGIEPLPGAPLVTSGAYAHLRHPIYAGIVIGLTGYTLVWSNLLLALLAGLVAWVYFHGKAKAEERWLVSRYRTYDEYMRQVPRRVL
jgi:protein-S-isoprenylcysteine O-methyltransferase Ste14